MATHPMGPGTVNLSINVRSGVRAVLGRAAFRLDLSTGEFCRRLFAAGARFATLVKTARSAAADDQSALARLRSAQSPASPGGVDITPAEAEQIARDIARSAAADERIATANLVEVAS